MGIFAHANNEDQILEAQKGANKPYLSPGLSGAYKKRSWAVEVVIGSFVAFIGLIFVIVYYSQSKEGQLDKTFLYIATGFGIFGGLLILLGLCWYKNLQKMKADAAEETSAEMNALGVDESAMTHQTMLTG